MRVASLGVANIVKQSHVSSCYVSSVVNSAEVSICRICRLNLVKNSLSSVNLSLKTWLVCISNHVLVDQCLSSIDVSLQQVSSCQHVLNLLVVSSECILELSSSSENLVKNSLLDRRKCLVGSIEIVGFSQSSFYWCLEVTNNVLSFKIRISSHIDNLLQTGEGIGNSQSLLHGHNVSVDTTLP